MITVALLGFAGTAAAGWTPARNLSTGTTDSLEPVVAVAPNGTATAAWTLDTGPGQDARARRLPLAGTPGPLRNLLVSNSAPDVAVTPKGISFVVWTTPAGKVLLRRIAANGSIGPAREIAATGQLAQVAVSPSGHAIVAWIRFSGMSFDAVARRVAPDGTPGGTTFTLGPAFLNIPAVVLAPNRTATVLWLGSDGTHQRAQSRRIARSGALGPVRNLSPAGGPAFAGTLGVATDGTVTAGWARNDGAVSFAQMRRINANGALGAVRTLSGPGQSVTQLDLAVAPSGVSTFLWNRSDGSVLRIQSRRIAANGTVGPIRNRSAAGRPASDLTISAGPTGVVFMAWRRLNGGLFDVAQALRVSPAGQPGKVKNVSAAGRNTNDLDIAVSRAGSATLVWYSNDGSKDVVQAARFRP